MDAHEPPALPDAPEQRRRKVPAVQHDPAADRPGQGDVPPLHGMRLGRR